MERHHLPTHCVAGIYDFGGIGRRAVGRKDKDCRSGDQRSFREEPAGCQRSLNTISYTIKLGGWKPQLF
jgi:hypothetical protein